MKKWFTLFNKTLICSVFIGLPDYQLDKPFETSTMVYFRKRLDASTLQEIIEKMVVYNQTPEPKRAVRLVGDQPNNSVMNTTSVIIMHVVFMTEL